MRDRRRERSAELRPGDGAAEEAGQREQPDDRAVAIAADGVADRGDEDEDVEQVHVQFAVTISCADLALGLVDRADECIGARRRRGERRRAGAFRPHERARSRPGNRAPESHAGRRCRCAPGSPEPDPGGPTITLGRESIGVADVQRHLLHAVDDGRGRRARGLRPTVDRRGAVRAADAGGEQATSRQHDASPRPAGPPTAIQRVTRSAAPAAAGPRRRSQGRSHPPRRSRSSMHHRGEAPDEQAVDLEPDAAADRSTGRTTVNRLAGSASSANVTTTARATSPASTRGHRMGLGPPGDDRGDQEVRRRDVARRQRGQRTHRLRGRGRPLRSASRKRGRGRVVGRPGRHRRREMRPGPRASATSSPVRSTARRARPAYRRKRSAPRPGGRCRRPADEGGHRARPDRPAGSARPDRLNRIGRRLRPGGAARSHSRTSRRGLTAHWRPARDS